MRENMYQQLVCNIRKYRTWVDVIDAQRETTYMVNISGVLHPTRCRTLYLIAKVRNGVYPKGYIWNVPEYMIDKAVNAMRNRKGFKERYAAGKLTMNDTEEIIYQASHTFIRLELEE
jgi:hypothetical protein